MNSRSHLSRRAALRGLLTLPALSACWPSMLEASIPQTADNQVQAALKDSKGTKLVLLGSGAGPIPGQTRHMQSSVLVHNGAAYVVDFGLGVTELFARTGVPFSAIRSIFITHQHPDHNIEYGPFLVIGWINGLQQTVRAFGPPPLTQITTDYLRSAKATIDLWAEDYKHAPLGPIACTDLAKAGAVMQDDNVKVSSALVQHPPMVPALGYRFDFPDRSIAFSGDTAPSAAIAELVKGADVLVHEAMDLPATEKMVRRLTAEWKGVSFEAMMQHMKAIHSPTEEVGRIAQQAGVKTLVLSHLLPSTVPDEKWIDGAAKFYKGRIIVGHDLMVV